MTGRQERVTANSSAEIGGVPTAIVLLGPASDRRTLRDVAALTIHETFHVFQRLRHPGWSGNEADLFTYPTVRTPKCWCFVSRSPASTASSGAQLTCQAFNCALDGDACIMTSAVAQWTAARAASYRFGVSTHGHIGRVGEASAVRCGSIFDAPSFRCRCDSQLSRMNPT